MASDSSPRYTLVALGRPNRSAEAVWRDAGVVGKVVNLTWAAPSGYRRNSRLLGIGFDSAAAALKVLFTRTGGPYLAANPWVGVALRLLGRKPLAVTGIYAQPGSRSHRVLRRVLGSTPVVTTVESEASAWVSDGGNAVSVLFGNTFEYPNRSGHSSETLNVFVGGASDRDTQAVARLEDEIRASNAPVRLTVVAGEAPSDWTNGRSSITHTGYVPQKRFGLLLADSDVVFLPLVGSERAAGHMVLVGALQVGIPVAATPRVGMTGYIDGTFVCSIDTNAPILPQLLAQTAAAPEPDAIRSFWWRQFSLEAYVARTAEALSSLKLRS
jgi:hypothetical protein